MGWILTLGLQNLRRQVNAAFPGRDTTSDGTIGDAAHQAETSGHNPDDTPGSRPEWDGDPDSTPEVRAWDMDSDLRTPGVTAQQVVDHIRALPGVSGVLRYMIYNRKIYKASNGWAPETYTGASAHTEHIHFSGQFTQAADNNTSFNYRLEELVMPTADEIAAAVWSYELRNPYSNVDQDAGDLLRYAPSRTPTLQVGDKVDALAGQVSAVQTALAGLTPALLGALVPAIVAGLPSGVSVTEEQLAAALVAALKQLAAPAA